MDERYIIGKTFIISEEQLNYLIDRNISSVKEWCYYNNFAGFEEEYPDHKFEFCLFLSKTTGLPADIMIDDSGNYVHDKHPMFMYIVLNENENYRYVPVLVHKFKPILLDESYDGLISRDILDEVKGFIKRNFNLISEYTNGRIGYREIKSCFDDRLLNEGLLTEMPKLKRGEVDLPTDIWVDGDRDLTHAKRIKFNDNNDKDSNTWATMTIDKFNPKVFNLSKNTKLSPKHISAIKDFVRVNYETLMLAANGELKTKDEILDGIICSNDISSVVYKDNDIVNIDYSKIGDTQSFTCDDKEISKKLMRFVSKTNILSYDNDRTVTINNFKLSGDPHTKSEVIKNIFYNAAKKLKVKINLMNINDLEIDFNNNTKTTI